MTGTLKDGTRNLRGLTVLVEFDGRWRRVVVVTRTHGTRWVVDGRELPIRFERYRGCRRTVVEDSQMRFIEPATDAKRPDRSNAEPELIAAFWVAVKVLNDRIGGFESWPPKLQQAYGDVTYWSSVRLEESGAIVGEISFGKVR